MLALYSSTTTSFSNLGLGILRDVKNDPIITEELNGTFILEFDYLKGGFLCDNLIEGNLIKCKNQIFRIKNINKSLSDSSAISILAQQFFQFDMSKNFLSDVAPTRLNAQDALKWLVDRAENESSFVISGDCTELSSARYVRKNVSDAIFSADNSLITRFGGELEYSLNNVYVHSKRGANKGFSIRYRKNLKGLEFNLDFSTVVTKICPQGTNELLLDDLYVESPKINNYYQPFFKKIDFNIGVDEEAEITEEMAKEQLKIECLKLFENGIDLPEISIKVDFIELSKCIEYKEYQNLESCSIGDTIQCIIPEFNINTSVRVVKTIYNDNLKRLTSLELGTVTKNIVTSQNSAIKEISKTIENPISILASAKKNATDMINHPFKGNLFIDKETGVIYLADTNDLSTAKNIWKWSMGGLGFSPNGINGDFETAITQDGSIVADFITTGKLNTSVIEGYDNLLLDVSKIKDVTRTVTANNYIEITDAAKGSIISFSIKGDLSLFFLSNQTFLGSNTFFKSSNLVVEDINGNKKKIQTNIGKLNTLNAVYDEFVTDDTGSYIIRRIGVNNDLSLYTLDNEVIEKLLLVNIKLNEGYNKIYMESFSNLIYTITYAKKNDYTDIFTRRVEMNALINVNNENIDLKLEKKTDKDKIIAQINMSTEKNEDGSLIQIESDRLNIKNKKFNLLSDQIEIESPNFLVTKEGKIASKSGEIGGFVIDENKLYGIHKKNATSFTQNDVTKIRNYLMGKITLTDEELEYLDYNKDGKVTSRDYVIISNLIKNANNEYTIELNSQHIDKLLNLQDANGKIISRIGTEGSFFNKLEVSGDFYFANQNNSNYRFFSSSSDDFDSLLLYFDSSKNGAFQIYSSDGNNISLKTSLYQNGTIDCVLLNQTSLESSKKNFEKFTSAIKEIMATDIYQYNLKSESDDHKKHLGFVIGDKYNYSHLITSVDNDGKEIGVDNYSMTALCLQAIKEQQLIIKKLESKIKELEVKINGNNRKERI